MTFDNVRRMAERGLMRAQQPPAQSAFIDMFQHILDEYEREAKAIHNAAIDEAVRVVKADYIGTDEMYEQDCIGLVEKIKELKQ